MILVGEGIHVISKQINAAVQDRNPGPTQELARLQEQAGADYLDLNLGLLSKNPVETMQWVVGTVQNAVDLPLSIDTLNSDAMRAALEICREGALVNCANAGKVGKETVFPLAKQYSANLIVMTFTDDGMPDDADGRAECVMDIVEYADELGIPRDKIWIDGVLLPACVNQNQVTQYIEFTKMFEELETGAKTITGLSNVSSCGTPEKHRQILNRTLYMILKRYGHSALIADVLDEEIVKLNRGEYPDLEKIIHRAEDGDEIDPDSLSDMEKAYVKTVDVLMGWQLYSHSWLEE